MKDSQAKHSWNRVANDWEGTSSISRVTVRDTALGFELSSVSMTSGAAIFVGVNSAGKSRLLGELYRALDDPNDRFARIEWSGNSPDPHSYVDLFDLVERQFKLFRDDQYEDLVDQAGFIALRAKEVANARFLVGRQYESIEVAEIDNTDVDSYREDDFAYRPEVVPLFRVTSYSRPTNSRELSRGEISILTAIWVMKQADKAEIIFWNEPDAFLSPASSGRLLTLIAEWSNARKLPTIMSSHSYLGLSAIPLRLQIMVRVNLKGVSRIESSNAATLWTTLRVSPPKRTVFVVEDRMARALLNRLLIEISFPDYDRVEIWLGTDADGVEIASKFASKVGEGTIDFIGVLDGDSRERLRQNPRLIALPGTLSPEQGALASLQEGSSFLGDSQSRLVDLLEETVGVDPHDRFRLISEGLGRSPEHFLVECWLVWLNGEIGARELATFARSCYFSVGLALPPEWLAE